MKQKRTFIKNFGIKKNILNVLFERIDNETVKQNFIQAIPFWIASLITGVMAVLYARLFLYVEKGTLALYHYHAWILFILTPACFTTSWWLVKKYSPYSGGSGIPQVMASIELATPQKDSFIHKLLSVRIIVVKILSSLIMILGGGIIGREGPTIQVAGSIFQKVNELLPKWVPKFSKKNIIIAGAASGLAAAFNAPLGGIVFAVEELSKTHINNFKSVLFTAVIIAGLTAQGLAGPYLYLGYPNLDHVVFSSFFGVIIVTAFAGLSAAIMGKLTFILIKKVGAWKINRHHLYFVLLCSLIVASFGFFFGEDALGSGKDLMTRLLFTDNKITHWYTPFLRINGLVFSFATGTSGGIFAPSLSAGASIGSAIAGWFHFSATDTNLLILSGMVAFLAGVTRSPFTCAILVLEMTDRHNVIFQLMFAGMFANILASFIDKYSIYEHLKRRYLHDILKEERLNNAIIASRM